MSEPNNFNRLVDETSPYLRQHQDNPVHWWAWGEAPFAAAIAENKPILLSVGYAACHWCHVMSHESFENPEIAALMNDLFVNIKVDREERPDVDAIYQKALAATGEQGGWPLTMFTTPDGKPFFGGTYFPPDARYGRPGFPDVLRHISKVYADSRKTVDEQASRLTTHISGPEQRELKESLAVAALDKAASHILDHFDSVNGGLGHAPKFPMARLFEFLWRAHCRGGETRLRETVVLTLDRICNGGIYDHLGGGFARYSTDERWLAPHFEKMLYDNAQLVDLLAIVWQETRSDLYRIRIEETIAWLEREMMGENGAFAATLDADSDGEEGKFYVWTKAEIDKVLGSESELFTEVYGVSPSGNWEGKNILNRIESHARRLNRDEENILASARARLLAVRGHRCHPGRDSKVLADWNGLMIMALARISLVFENPKWLALGKSAFDSIVSTMTWADSRGRVRLAHSFCDGRQQRVDMLDDYANMIGAALALAAATGENRFVEQAAVWADLVHDLFWNDGARRYFFATSDDKHLIVRPSTVADSATPSGNGVMLDSLARLYHLTGHSRFQSRANDLVDASGGEAMGHFPHTCAFLNGFEVLVGGQQVVVVGSRAEDAVQALFRAALRGSNPNLILSTVAATELLPASHAAFGKARIEGKASAYVCRGPVCQAPVTTAAALHDALLR